MKKLKFFFLLIPLWIIVSACSQETDICLNGEGTPRMKVKFINQKGQIKMLDTLVVYVNFAGKKMLVDSSATPSDSVYVPLQVNGSGTTDFYIKRKFNGAASTVHMTYTENTNYVSAACGIRKTYSNVAAQLTVPNPVTGDSLAQTSITDETKTVLYLKF